MVQARARLTSIGAMILLMLPAKSNAQSGRIVGTVSDPSNVPVVGAQVLITGLGLSTLSGEGGRFTISGVPVGSYDVRIFHIGHKPVDRKGVAVTASADTRVNVTVETASVRLQGVVVSAARHAEKVTDASATIHAVDASTLDSRIGNSYTLALRNVPGLDVTQVGITSVFVNGRGFNNRFNTRWLTLEDGRIATLAETGLPIGEHTTIPKLDVATMEVLTGPGSALYGANASNGALSIRSKDPRTYPGLSTEVSGGGRELLNFQARYAGSTGKLGYKLAGEHLSANDFSTVISYPAVTSGGPTLPETIADWRTSVNRLSGALVFYPTQDSRLTLNSGISQRDGVGDSNSGHYQIDNYQYSNHQLQFTSPRWLAQAYITHSNSGDTYQLYAAVPLQARNPLLTADSVRKATRFHVDGRVYAAELQNNFLVRMLLRTGVNALDNSLITSGTQLSRVRVSSYQTVFRDVLTRKPILLDNNGVYAQVETPFTSTLRTVVAARYDLASRFAAQLSPRMSVLYSPAPDQTIRITYGEAYRAPPILTTEAYNTVSATQRNVGNANGFTVKDSNGVVVSNISRMVPETNKAWELGYKAVIGTRWFIDVTAWHSTFVNFMSGGLVVADPFTGAKLRAFNPETGALYTDAAGKPVRVQTNFNVGEGITNGLDGALRFYFTNHFALASSVSWTQLDTIKLKPTDPIEASQFNASSNRMSMSLEMSDLPKGVHTSATTRYVRGYSFRSGIVGGVVPTYGNLDVTATWKLRDQKTTLVFQAQNIAACVGGTSTPPVKGLSSANSATYTKGQKCGLGLKHQELLSMPALGPMLLVGARRQWW